MRVKFRIRPLTAFGTPLLGETLFGQLCCAIKAMHSEEKLVDLLRGYCEGRPFAVLSDAFPGGYLPLPSLPSFLWEEEPEADRKVLKARAWISTEDCSGLALPKWRSKAKATADVPSARTVLAVSTHNTISRISGTTGEGGRFAPFAETEHWFEKDAVLDVYAVLDEERFSSDELCDALSWIGASGYGRNAGTGLGKFSVEKAETLKAPKPSKTLMTLASCAPSSDGADEAHSYYRLKVHFGRHGAAEALGPNPFKKPILLAERGAVLSFNEPRCCEFVGRGLGSVSLSLPSAVHQGYAPVVALDNQ